jgi:hypothetical protein
MFKSLFKAAKTLVSNKSTKVVRNKSGSTSSFTKIKSNGKSSWKKTGGSDWSGTTNRKKGRKKKH